MSNWFNDYEGLILGIPFVICMAGVAIGPLALIWAIVLEEGQKHDARTP